MGGFGSTRWAKAKLSYHPNETDCEVVDTSELHHHDLFNGSACAEIVIDWKNFKRAQCRSLPRLLELTYTTDKEKFRLYLEYQGRPVTLRSGPTTQYYVLCPLCKRQVRKLYRPSSSMLFACRQCIQLRYKSQTMHHSSFLYVICRAEKVDNYTAVRMAHLGRMNNRAMEVRKRHNMTYRGQPTRYWRKAHPRPVWKQAAYKALDWL